MRLAENERVLIEARNLLTETVKANRRIAPAGEWLIDNFYVIEEQIRMARRHLPKGYSRELPRLLNGPSAGLPRVYDIALEIISHGDGRVDPENLSSFVAAYQSVTTLKLGELWAIPIALLSGHNHADYGYFHRGFVGQGACHGVPELVNRADRSALAGGRESSGRGAGELAGDITGAAALAAANGLFRRNSFGIARPGRDPDDAHEHTKH